MSKTTSVFYYLDQHVKKTPDEIAFQFLDEQGPEIVTYAELKEIIQRIATHLPHTIGERVLIALPSGLAYTYSFLACMYAGLIPVPVFPPKNSRQMTRLDSIIKNASARYIILEAPIVDSSFGNATPLYMNALMTVISKDKPLLSTPRLNKIAYLQYTSGSTSEPKGVMVTHANILANCKTYIELIPSAATDFKMGSWLPYFHDLGLFNNVIYPLYFGGCSVVFSPEHFIGDPLGWLAMLSRYKITTTVAPDFGYRLLIQALEQVKKDTLLTYNLAHLRTAINCAEPILFSTAMKMKSYEKQLKLQRSAFRSGYGLAESTLIVSMDPLGTAFQSRTVSKRQLEQGQVVPSQHPTDNYPIVSSGLISKRYDLRIVDAMTGDDVGHDRIGEIWLRGDSITAGYWNNEKATTDTYHAYLSTGEGPYLRTGDLGFVDEAHHLYVTGRVKDLIIIRGRNLYPQDIEQAVLESHVALKGGTCVAFALAGDSGEMLCLVVELKPKLNQNEIALLYQGMLKAIFECADSLPAHILLVPARSIPKTTSGKVQRQATRSLYLKKQLTVIDEWRIKAYPKGMVQDAFTRLALTYPTSYLEIMNGLKTILSLLCGLESHHILPDHSFFDYGLDSVQSILCAGCLSRWLGCDIEPTVFWEHVSIAALATHLAGLLQLKTRPIHQEPIKQATLSPDEPIAIIGFGCRLPGGIQNEVDFWQLLCSGVDPIQPFPVARQNDIPSLIPFEGGYLDTIDQFDASFFNISPREADMMDPQQRLVLEVTHAALEQASIAINTLKGKSVGVFIGASGHDYALLMEQSTPALQKNAYYGTGIASSSLSGRLSFILGLQGPSQVIDTACSSSLVAVHEACQSLLTHESELAIAGGVNLVFNAHVCESLNEAMMLSPDARCKTFDASANGYVRSEGCGIVILKPLSAARRDGDRVYGVIRGTAVNHDGTSNGYTAPNVTAQKALYQDTLNRAQLDANTVDFIETHGTGTALGDPIEVSSILSVYGQGRTEANPLILGALKSHIGHLEAAAGVAGLIKVILCLQHQQIPANLHLHHINPLLTPYQTQFKCPDALISWPSSRTPRRVGVSSFGFSGTNAHVVVEEAPVLSREEKPEAPKPSCFILPLSAKTKQALVAQVKNYTAYIEGHPALSLENCCYTAAIGRSHYAYRVAVMGETREALLRHLNSLDSATYEAIEAVDGLVHFSYSVNPIFSMKVDCEGELSDTIQSIVASLQAACIQLDWRVITQALSSLYLQGVVIDWISFYAPWNVERVMLPTYPFQRVRHWVDLEALAPKNQFLARCHQHPFLSGQLESPLDVKVFEVDLDIKKLRFLRDHCIYEHLVFPGSGYVELVSAAVSSLRHETDFQIRSLELTQALELVEKNSKAFQLVVTPQENGEGYDIAFYSKASDTPWVLHARAVVSFGMVEEGAINRARLQAGMHAWMGRDTFYSELADQGIVYGPSFQVLESAYVSGERVLAHLVLQEPAAGFMLHPALLDGCFQVVGLSLKQAEKATHGLYMPVSIQGFSCHGELGQSVWVLIDLSDIKHTASGYETSLTVYDESGLLQVRIEAFEVKAVSRQQLAAVLSDTPDISDWFYQWRWMKMPSVNAYAPIIPLSWPPMDIVQVAQGDVSSSCQDEVKQRIICELVHAFQSLPVSWSCGLSITVEALCQSGNVVPSQARLVGHLMGVLTKAGYFTRVPHGDNVCFIQTTSLVADGGVEWPVLMSRYPDCRIELGLMARCLHSLVGVLQGRVVPLNLLFDTHDGISATALYQESPGYVGMNEALAQCFKKLVAAVPEGRVLRVLEIGAGTGGTTQCLLPYCTPTSTYYCYTDISAGFFDAARHRFDAYGFIDYHVLDIETSPRAQGFAPQQFDVVIASNVLHATRSMQVTLGHVYDLLAPNGQLLILEGMKPSLFADVTFGLLEGWWRFNDVATRADYPLMECDAWDKRLLAAGFDASQVLCRSMADEVMGEQVVLSATRPLHVTSLSLSSAVSAAGFLLIGPSSARLGIFEQALLGIGECVTVVSMMDDETALAQLMTTAYEYVVFCFDSSTTDTVPEDSLQQCLYALKWMHRLMSGHGQPQLYWLTHGAQALCEGDPINLSQSALWGMGRTIQNEWPEYRLKLIDFSEDASEAEESEAFISALFEKDDEHQLLIRDGHRYVGRLEAAPELNQRHLLVLDSEVGYQIKADDTGHLSQLSAIELQKSSVGSDSIRVNVKATGLNFKDVLLAMQVLPDSGGLLGGDFSGVVIEVGEAVDFFQVGDRVLGVAEGALVSELSIPAQNAVKIPHSMSFACASMLPAVYMTVYFSLHDVYPLKSGDRILIHAATGGVGLAAIQYARCIGATVYATAGSVRKRRYLRSLGILHVYDSKSLDFVAAILNDTNERGVDIVLNCLTGPGFVAGGLDICRQGGAFIELSKRDIWSIESVATYRPDICYTVVALDNLFKNDPETVPFLLRTVMDWYQRAGIAPLPYTTFFATESVEAFHYLAKAEHIGKVVITHDTGVGEQPRGEVKSNCTYIVTGGLNGLGWLVCEWLVAQGARHIALLARSVPNASRQQQLDAWSNEGLQVLSYAVDVGEKEQLENALLAIKACSPEIKGVIHCAGVLSDATMPNQTEADFRAVFRAKVQGAWYLHECTTELNLDQFIVFSSVAGLLGSMGQANHAAANVFLDALIQVRLSAGLPGLSINWGAWGEVGSAVGVIENSDDALVLLMQPALAMERFSRLWQQGAACSHAAVVAFNYGALSAQQMHLPAFANWLQDAPRTPSMADSIGLLVRNLPEAEGKQRLLAFLQRELAGVLHVSDPSTLNPKAGLTDLGMDSLMMVAFRNRLKRYFPQVELGDVFGSLSTLVDALYGQSDRIKTTSKISSSSMDDVAIIGMGCQFPGGADSVDTFAALLFSGRDGISELTKAREALWIHDNRSFDKNKPILGGYLGDVSLFDSQFFNISPKEAACLDPQQRLLLEVTQTTFEQAGIDAATLRGSRTGVFMGVCSHDYGQLLDKISSEIENTIYIPTGNAASTASGRISYVYGLEGPNMVVDTACSSALVSVHLACNSLLHQESDLALAGGVNVLLNPMVTEAFRQGQMLSPDGYCKTFDKDANGFVRSEGCGVVLLKRLSDAVRDGDTILAVIKGSAVNQDGASSGLTVPNPLAQKQVIQDALQRSGIKPSDISFVETHGTGTALGDPIEVEALKAVYMNGRGMDVPLILGAVKSQIGHLEAAAGIAGLIKLVLMLQQQSIPANLHFNRLNPHIDLEGLPLCISTDNKPWELSSGHKRIAAVSSFGFSGTNAHVVVEEAPVLSREEKPEAPKPSCFILPLSAKTKQALVAQVKNYTAYIEGHPALSLENCCYTAAIGRSHYAYRVAVMGETREALLRHLNSLDSATYEAIEAVDGLVHFSYSVNPIFSMKVDCEGELSDTIQSIVASLQAACIQLDWRVITQALSSLYLQGVVIDWISFYAPWNVERVMLPTYPFQRVRHWVDLEALAPKNQFLARCHQHPFLSGQLESPADTKVFEVDLDIKKLRFLRDHCIYEHLVFPGSGYVELVSAAVSSLRHETDFQIRSLELTQALELVEKNSKAFQLVVTPQENGEGYDIAFYSKASDTPWVLHARAVVSFGMVEEGAINRARLQAGMHAWMGRDTFYSELADQGIVYGPSFQVLESAYVSGERVLAHLVLQEPAAGFVLHPALLDGCFQVVGLSLKQAEKATHGLYMPVSIQGFSCHGELGQSVWVVIDLSDIKHTASGYETSLTVYDESGLLQVRIEAFEVKAVSRQQLAAVLSDTPDISDWFYQWHWMKMPSVNAYAPIIPLSWPPMDIVQVAQGDVSPSCQDEVKQRIICELVHAFQSLPVSWSCGLSITVEALCQSGNVVPSQARLVGHLMGVLTKAGYFTRVSHGDNVRFIQTTSLVADGGVEWPVLMSRYPDCRIELGLMARCLHSLVGILQGRVVPLNLLFDTHDGISATALYQESPGYVGMNEALAQCFKKLVAAVPEGRVLRVLEIGAGTGGTTQCLLPYCTPTSTYYCYTDISAGFFDAARHRFDAYGFIDYHVLDIETSPRAQGFAPQQFDVVIASNVLHATRSMQVTLGHVYDLLAPNGQLLILEGMKPSLFADVTFGLLEGWWRFNDVATRADYPLMECDAWDKRLLAAGFDASQVLCRSMADEVMGEQVVLSATRPLHVTSLSLSSAVSAAGFLLIGPSSARLGIFEQALLGIGECVTVVSMMDDETALAQLMTTAYEYVVFCFDASTTDTVPEDSLQQCLYALKWMQRLMKGHDKHPRLYWLTQSAQALLEGDVVNLSQSALWGMGRTIQNECPEYQLKLIDLTEHASAAEEAQAFISALFEKDDEHQLLIRDGHRYVGRLEAAPELASEPLVDLGRMDSFHQTLETSLAEVASNCTYVVTGGLHGLGWLVCEWLVAQGARHIALLARSMPAESQQQQLDAWSDEGLEIFAYAVDVGDRLQLEKTLLAITTCLPEIKGIIHCAGVLSDATIPNQTEADFRAVFRAKVEGAWYLHECTTELNLDQFIVFSSVAGLLGSMGQANHAAANVFLDALIQVRLSAGLPGLSINWGAWGEVGSAVGVIENSDDALVSLMKPVLAMEGFSRLWQQGRRVSHAAVVAFNHAALSAQQMHLPAFTNWLQDVPRVPLMADSIGLLVQNLPEAEGKQRLLAFLQRELAGVLHVSDPSTLNPKAGLTDLGMDSLMMVAFRNRLKRYFPQVELGDVFGSLSTLVDALYGESRSIPMAPQPPTLSMDDVAIIGVACQFPGGADSIDSFAGLLLTGRDGISDATDERRRLMGVSSVDSACYPGGYLDDENVLDNPFFNSDSNDAKWMAPQQRVLFKTIESLFEHADLDAARLKGSSTGVFIGMASQHRSQAYGIGLLDEEMTNRIMGDSSSMIAAQLSHHYGLEGPNMAVDTACSSSLVSVHLACQSLILGESDLALAGGINLLLDASITQVFQKKNMLSTQGRCKTFDKDADGYVRGEGCGLILLKRLTDARRDGDKVLAVIKGSAVSQGGEGAALTVPNSRAEEQLIKKALKRSGVAPSDVSFVEVHGTGTLLGDALEVEALKNAYMDARHADNHLILGALKTQIGHLEWASGIASIIKVVLMFKYKTIPKNLHFNELNPHIDLDGMPLRIARESEVWAVNDENKRLAGVSAFGLTGTNAHIILEEPPVFISGIQSTKEEQKGEPVTPVSTNSALESRVIAIWQTVLGVEDIGDTDSFFELGGGSLTATQVLSAIHTELQLECDLKALFRYPRIKELAAYLAQAKPLPTYAMLKPVQRTPLWPLSHGQQRLYFLDSYADGHDLSYLTGGIFRLRGKLHHQALAQAIYALSARHEVLRTYYIKNEAGVFQSWLPVDAIWLDISACLEVELEYTLQQVWRTAFQLNEGPLAHFSLYVLSPDDHVFSIKMHHSITDGESLQQLIQELQWFYSEYASNRIPNKPALPIQYADYVVWQEQWLTDEHLKSQMAYWQQQLAGIEPLQLPLDFKRPRQLSTNGRTLLFELPASTVASLHELTKKADTTLFMVLYAGLVLLLQRYTGQSDVLIGTVLAGRRHPLLKNVHGFFVNTLPLRQQLSNDWTLGDLLAAVKMTCLDAYAHQDLPFERLLESINVPRDTSRHPLFQVMLILQTIDQERLLCWPGFETKIIRMNNVPAQFDLTFEVIEQASGLSIALNYNTDLFEESTIKRLFSHLGRVYEQFIDINQSIDGLDILTPQERNQLLYEWNATEAAYPADKTVHQLFEAQVARTPDNIALVMNDSVLTYRELNQRANQLAHCLRTLYKEQTGTLLKPDTLIVICMERCFEMVIGLLAILKAGAAYVPCDPDYPEERLRLILSDTKSPLLLTHHSVMNQHPWLFDTREGVFLVNVDAILWDDWSCENPVSINSARDLMYVIYTSGSTGVPKGVMCMHQGCVNRLTWMSTPSQLTETRSVLQATTLTFDSSVLELFCPLLQGFKMILLPKNGLQDISFLLKYIREHQVTDVQFVPSLLRRALDHLDFTNSFLQVKHIYCGGEVLPFTMAQAFFQLNLSSTLLWNMYGPTEAGIDVSYALCSPMRKSISIGQPIQNTCLLVLDPNLRVLPIGVIGELYIAGAGLARGYLNRPELTAERFIDNPFVTAADRQNNKNLRLYKTGDLVRWLADGTLEYIGRIDNQIKLRGFRIELGEIESILMRLDGIAQVVVSSYQRNLDDESTRQLVAYYVANKKEQITADTLDAFSRMYLPDYMVPSLFIPLDAIPLTANGKVDKKALPQPFESIVVSEPPLTATEQALALIWSKILCCSLDLIGRDSDFFSLGGHSLNATQVLSFIQGQLQRNCPLKALFEYRRLRLLASFLDKAGAIADWPALEAISREAPLPLSYGQQRLWFLDSYAGGSDTTYLSGGAYYVRGAINESALAFAVRDVVRRHEVLRTVYTEQDGLVLQSWLPISAIDLTVNVVSSEDALRAAVEAEWRTPFCLREGPLASFTLYTLSEQAQVLSIKLHHSITDGWSLYHLIKELRRVYIDYISTGVSSIAALSIQYADYAVWQRAFLNEALMDAQASYWKKQLSDMACLQLPTDRVRPRWLSTAGKTCLLTLDTTLTDSLHRLATDTHSTLFMVLYAGLLLVLQRYSGQSDIVIGTVVAGRRHPLLDNIQGFFVNTLVLRQQIASGWLVHDLLKAVKETCIGAYEHQDLPFEQLVDRLMTTRDTSRHPLVQVMLVLQSMQDDGLGEWPDLEVSSCPMVDTPAKFDLSVDAFEQAGSLNIAITYNTALYDEETIRRLSMHLKQIYEQLHALNQPIDALEILTPQERNQLLYEWNATEAAYPADKTVHQLFEAQVARTPDNIALVMNDSVLTYRELNQRANQLAHCLRTLYKEQTGTLLKPDTLIVICMERCFEMVIGLLAILKAGAAYVPCDPDYPEERLRLILSDTKSPLLLTHHSVMNQHPWLCDTREGVFNVDAILWDDWSCEDPVSINSSNDLMYVLYTSGSTGVPKGVMCTHQGVVNKLEAMQTQFQLTETGCMLQKTKSTFDVSVWELFWPLLYGAKACLLPMTVQQDIFLLLQCIREHAVSDLHFVPSLLTLALEHPDFRDSFLHVKHIYCGGEVLPRVIAEKFFQFNLSSTLLWNTYGPTEASITVSYALCEPRSKSISIGKPIQNTHLMVLDPDLRLLPIGVIGELYIAGAGLARGYLNRPELTAERFIENPFATAADRQNNKNVRLYKTGDLVRWLADGRLEYIGRIDNQIKLRGFRIELGEIEAVLMRLDGIAQVVVTLYQRDLDDDSTRQLLAYYVPSSGFVDEERLRASLRAQAQAHLPDYMIPSLFIPMDHIPLTSNGKIDRKALPNPTDWQHQPASRYPSTDEEKLLALAWAAVLHHSNDSIHVEDHFFELGGDSIKSIQVVSYLQRAGYTLSVRSIFEFPRLIDMALCMCASEKTALLPISMPLMENNRLVALKTSSDDSLLVLIHPGGGGIECYEMFSKNLKTKWSIVAIQFEVNSAPNRIESIADLYVNDVMRRYPNKKLHLLGYSLGGIIAYEMAKILERDYVGYETLVVVDTFPRLKTDVHEVNLGLYAASFEEKCILSKELGVSINELSDYLESTKAKEHALIKAAEDYITEGVVSKLAVFYTNDRVGLVDEDSGYPTAWAPYSKTAVYYDIVYGIHEVIFSSKYYKHVLRAYNKFLKSKPSFK